MDYGSNEEGRWDVQMEMALTGDRRGASAIQEYWIQPKEFLN